MLDFYREITEWAVFMSIIKDSINALCLEGNKQQELFSSVIILRRPQSYMCLIEIVFCSE